MPRQLKEIKNFNTGTILNASERDIPQDSPSFSLNVNPMSEHGILSAIKNDRIVASYNKELTSFANPVTWGTVGNTIVADPSPMVVNHYRNRIANSSIFNDEAASKISFVGTKGKKETLTATYIEPVMEKLFGVTTDSYTFIPSAAFSATDSSISFYTKTNTIAENLADSELTVSGFDDGVATINVAGTTLADFDGKLMSFRTPDGKNIQYEFGKDNNEGASGTHTSGALTSGGNTLIQLHGETTVAGIATEIKTAIENATNGHGTRISITRTTGLLTLTYKIQPLNNGVLNVGDYISFVQTNDTFTGRDEFEIMRVLTLSDTNMTVKRNCFGTQSFPTLSTSNEYYIYANRVTNGTQTAANQFPTTMATCKLYDWSGHSGNNVNTNASFLTKTSNEAGREKCGKIESADSNKAVVYDATNKTITLGSSNAVGSGDVLFNEGDTITIYQSGTSANNGNSFKILKKTTNPVVFTVDEAPTQDTESTDRVYIEANLIKNHTFHHVVSDGTITPGASAIYKCNDWLHKSYGVEGEASTIDNVYDNDVTTKVSIQTSGGVWDAANYTFGETAAAETAYYPFGGDDNDNDSFIRIESEYVRIRVPIVISLSATDTKLQFASEVDTLLSRGDIIAFEASTLDGSTEYMKVDFVSGNIATVLRGYFGTTAISHSVSQPYKCKNHLISQDISKSRLKAGGQYKLSFFARDNDATNDYASLDFSLKINGGYINKSGQWMASNNNRNSGFIDTYSSKNISQEQRWINLNEIYSSLGDTLIDTWRNFTFHFSIPRNVEIESDLTIEFASRGKHNGGGIQSYIDIDLLDLSEVTSVYKANTYTGDSYLVSNYINNSGRKDLVSIGFNGGTFSVIEGFSASSTLQTPSTNIIYSPISALNISSSSGPSVVSKNRALHMGFGSTIEDSRPQWLGYLNHKVFGESFNNQLYQDDNSVSTLTNYGGTSGSSNITNISKICTAGEFEYLPATWDNSAKTLKITHASHKVSLGDNLIIREYGDASNEWTGSGIWVVTNNDPDSDGDAFICKRYNTKDPDPDNTSFMQSDGARDENTGKICYRPYYYYGIEVGEPYIYRIWPEDRIKTDVTNLDEVYFAGKIERSLSLNFPINSIATCYAKEESASTAALNGGRVYILPTFYDNSDGVPEVHIYDIMRSAEAWSAGQISKKGVLKLQFRSFKWSNDGTNGDIGSSTAVFDSVASQSTPIIKFGSATNEGYNELSDILETKAPNEKYVHEVTTNVTNEPDHFDTRLWVQANDIGGYSQNQPFVFCGRTPEAIMADNYNDTFNLGDRSPSTKFFDGANNAASSSWSTGSDNQAAYMFDFPGDKYFVHYHVKHHGVAYNNMEWSVNSDAGDVTTFGTSYFIGGPQVWGDLFVYRGTQFTQHMADTGWSYGDNATDFSMVDNNFSSGAFDVLNATLNPSGWGMTLSAIRPMTEYFYLNSPPHFQKGGFNGGHDSEIFPNYYNTLGLHALTDDMTSNNDYYIANMDTSDPRYTSYINFGYNVGFQSKIKFRQPRFGLFQMGDNDRDGLIDGTGLVVPSTTSLTTEMNDRHMGPYGEYHRRVCGHVVGILLINKEDNWDESSWIAHNGKMACYGKQYFHSSLPENGISDINDSNAVDYLKMSPKNVDTPYFNHNKTKIYLATCPDAHFGDYEMPPQLTAHASGSVASGQYTKVQLASGNSTATLQAGDPIFIADDPDYGATNYGATYISSIHDDDEFFVPVAHNSSINNAKIYPMTPALGYDYQTHVNMVNNVYNTGCISKFPAFHRAFYPEEKMNRIPFNNLFQPAWDDDEGDYEWNSGERGYLKSFNDLVETHSGGTKKEFRNMASLGKTFYTVPTRFGVTGAFGTKTSGQPDGRGFAPGIISKIESLNYKSGVMLRPVENTSTHSSDSYGTIFNFDNNDNLKHINYMNICVDAPSFPDNIYHKKQGSNLSSSINNNENNNQFSSRIYMSHLLNDAQTEDIPGHKKGVNFYSIDLNLLYPSSTMVESIWQINSDFNGADTPTIVDESINYNLYAGSYLEGSLSNNVVDNGQGTNYYKHLFGNYNKPMLVGRLTAIEPYITTADADYPAANLQPYIKLDGTTGSIYHGNSGNYARDTLHNYWATSSQWRDRGAFSGLMISILDKETGCIQTRQIVDSKSQGSSATSDAIYVMVHYPFGHNPSINDYYYIWTPWQACTAPVRLAKQQTIPFEFTNSTTGLVNYNNYPPNNAYIGDPIAKLPMKREWTYSISDNIGSSSSYLELPETEGNKCSVSGSGVVTCTYQHGLTTGDKVWIRKVGIPNPTGYTVTVTGSCEFTVSTTTAITDAYWYAIPIINNISSVQNPIALNFSGAVYRTMFGGFNMRKLREYAVSVTANDSDDLRLSSTAHKLSDGDTVTFKSEMIENENDRTFASASNWTEYSPDGSAPTFSDDGSPANLVITNLADTDPQGATLGTGSLRAVSARTYRITAELWTDSGTLTNVSMGIGGTASDTFSITTTKTYYSKEVVASSDAALIISSTHNGTITWNIDNVSVQDVKISGTFNTKDIATSGANAFDVAHKDEEVLQGRAYTNYWEMFLIESGNGSESRITKIRDNWNSWDRGASEFNLLRNDSSSAVFEDMFMTAAFNNIIINPGSMSTSEGSGNTFETDVRYEYKISFIYDGYQEGPLSSTLYSDSPNSAVGSYNITLAIKNYSRRLTHVCIYRRNGVTDFFRLVKEVSTATGWSQSEEGVWSNLIVDTGKLGATYESRTGMSEILETVDMKYGISTEIDGYLIVGDCSHQKVLNASNMLFRSRPGMFSLFDWVNDFILLKSKPTALANFNGRLYAFDSTNIYRINQETLVIEDIFEGIGCIDKYSVLVTEYGMFFVDITGIYLHDGTIPRKISEPISESGEVDTDFYSLLGGDDNIVDASWKNIVNQPNFTPPSLILDSSTSSVLVVFKINHKEGTNNASTVKYFVWSYNIPQSRWDLWDLCEDSNVGKPFLGTAGEVCIPIGDFIYEYKGGIDYRDYTWVSKKITVGEDSIVKVFNKIKLNGIKENVNLDGSNTNSQNKLLLVTSTGNISNSDTTYSSTSTNDSQYKISSSNKKGRWLQFKLENMDKELDSIGILYRRKSTK